MADVERPEGEPMEGGEPTSNEPGAEMEPTSTPEIEVSNEIEKGVAEIHDRLQQIEEPRLVFTILKDPKSKEVRAQRFVRVMQRPS